MIDSIEPLLCEVIVISYDGQVDDKTDQYNGMGVAIMDNQCSYEGYFKGGFFHGKGKFTWADGVSFEGEFVSGMVRKNLKFMHTFLDLHPRYISY